MSILHKQEKLIIEGDIFLEICDKDKAPIVFKVEDRNAFFEKLDKQNFSIVFKLIKKQMECS